MVESPSLRCTFARGGVLLSAALVGCFNPSAKDSDPTDPATGEPATGDPTGDPATAEPTVTGTMGPTEAPPTTTEEPGTTTQPGCDCPPETPYCTAMGCGTCEGLGSSNSTCAALDSEKPLCDPVSGLCAACTLQVPCEEPQLCHPSLHTCVGCVGEGDCDDPETGHCDPDSHMCVPCERDEDCSGFGPTATCDLDKHACRGCTEHSDCPTTACDLAKGECFPLGEATTHAYVDKIVCDVMVDPPLCPADKPCCEISRALKPDILDPQQHIVIHVNPGVYVAPVPVAVDGKRIAILATEGVSLVIGDTETAALSLSNGLSTALFVSRVNVLGPMATAGVLCSQNTDGLWYEDAAIRVVNGAGMFATMCGIKARRVEMSGNVIGVQASNGGTINLVNSYVAGSHPMFALQMLADGAIDLVYSSVLDRDATANHLVDCNSEPLTVRNSIVATAFVGGVIPACTIMSTDSAFSTDVVTSPAADVVIAPASFSTLFNDWNNNDLHLRMEAAPILTVAEWMTGDPETDFDGKPRPTAPNSPDVAGAFLP